MRREKENARDSSEGQNFTAFSVLLARRLEALGLGGSAKFLQVSNSIRVWQHIRLPRIHPLFSTGFKIIQKSFPGGRMDLQPGLGGSVSAAAIDSSNIGFQLLKKHGWREGTGLGVSEQGRLEPVQASVKNNKRGLGADKAKKKLKETNDIVASDRKNNQERSLSKKAKAMSKKMRKMQEEERLYEEKEFERAFFREFWPDNV